MGEQSKVYRQGQLIFIVNSEKTMVKTSLHQMFILQPKMHYWRRRLRLINTMIQLGEIRDLNELSEWCGDGVAWIATDYTIETAE